MLIPCNLNTTPYENFHGKESSLIGYMQGHRVSPRTKSVHEGESEA